MKWLQNVEINSETNRLKKTWDDSKYIISSNFIKTHYVKIYIGITCRKFTYHEILISRDATS